MRSDYKEEVENLKIQKSNLGPLVLQTATLPQNQAAGPPVTQLTINRHISLTFQHNIDDACRTEGGLLQDKQKQIDLIVTELVSGP